MTEAMTAHSVVATYRVRRCRGHRARHGAAADPADGPRRAQDLVDSGDLDPALLAEVPTFTLHGAAVEWSPDRPGLRPLWPDDLTCPQAYVCLLDPEAPACADD